MKTIITATVSAVMSLVVTVIVLTVVSLTVLFLLKKKPARSDCAHHIYESVSPPLSHSNTCEVELKENICYGQIVVATSN